MNLHLRWYCSALAFFLVAASTLTRSTAYTVQVGEPFRPGCTLPFDAIKDRHPIDDECGPVGSANTDPQREQNQAKNNFCAQGKPVAITISSLVRLQRAVEEEEIPFGSSNKLPADRSVLGGLVTLRSGAKIGEGTIVTLVAFVVNARFSNLSKGESVNCKKGGRENNDIHIELGRTPDDDACNAVTAEISPHFRPTAWEEIDGFDRYERPMKMTGPLFFDASHAPCRAGKRASPARASVWEIHPVYGIEVCKNKTLRGCPAGDKSKWVPFHEWVSEEEEEPGQR